MNWTKQVGTAALAFLAVATAAADEWGNGGAGRNFEVTVTNISPGISFTPLLIATHSSRTVMFRLGQPATDALATLAEAGDTAPLLAALQQSGEMFDSVVTSGLLAPGASVKVQVRANGRFDRLSIAGMLLPTNDGFIGLNSFELPWDRMPKALTAVGYDAGSEPNDESCASIPGPHCGGVGASPGVGGEDFIHVHGGIHGFADLNASTYDWRNPMALVSIRRVP